MAIRYAVATGNWSDVSTWDGGVSLPTVGDDVYANGFTVTLDQDIEVTKISTEVCPTTTVGGGNFSNSIIINIIADIYGGISNCLYTINTTTVIGDIYGIGSIGIYIKQGNILFVIGNVYGNGAPAISQYATTTAANNIFYITGNLYSSTSVCVYFSYYGILNLTGDIQAASDAAVVTEHANINGIIKASATNCGIIPTKYHKGTIIVNGVLENINSKMAIGGFYDMYLSPTSSTVWKFYDTNDDEKILYTEDAFDQPGEENVREGTSYASATLEGTLAVPDPSNVVAGVPTDDTVGTWAFDPELISRLEHCSTIDITGEQVAGFECP